MNSLNPRSSLSRDETVEVRGGEELDVPRLHAYLRSHLPSDLRAALPAQADLEVRKFPGGYSNLTYLLTLGGLDFVLRRPPVGNQVQGAHDMGREYRVLDALAPVYAVAPRAYLYCDDLDVLGVPFYVMERCQGVILRRGGVTGRDGFPGPGGCLGEGELRRLSEAFVDQLADLHGLDYAAAGLGDLGRPEGYVERQVKGWTERYRKAQTDELTPVEAVIGWLDEQLPSMAHALSPARAGAALLHNDYKYDNLVLDPDDLTRVRAVLDWEMCTVGTPLLDLGTSLAYWIEAADGDAFLAQAFGPTYLAGSLTRSELAERYAARTGADLGPLLFAYVTGLFKLAVIGQQIYARYRRGLTRDERFAGLGKLVAGCGMLALRALDQGSV